MDVMRLKWLRGRKPVTEAGKLGVRVLFFGDEAIADLFLSLSAWCSGIHSIRR